MKQTVIRKVSKKMAIQKRKESKLKKELTEQCGGLCQECGRFAPLDKHEKIFRGQCGDPLDPDNCLMLCRFCHDKKHGKG